MVNQKNKKTFSTSPVGEDCILASLAVGASFTRDFYPSFDEQRTQFRSVSV